MAIDPCKVIIGRDAICSAYSIGRDIFYKLLEEKAPIGKLGDKYFIHRDEFDEYLRKRSLKDLSK
jgi:hypothetical protein